MAIINITLSSNKETKMVNTVGIERIYTPTKSKDNPDSNACIVYLKPHPTRPNSQQFDFCVETTKEIWAMIESQSHHS